MNSRSFIGTTRSANGVWNRNMYQDRLSWS